MAEKNVNQRLLVIGAIVLVGAILLWSAPLRPGLDIAGGTSLIFEIDTTGIGSDPGLAERVKTQLQKRVDPRGLYNLTWRVQGNNRLEVQLPLPPKDAKERREAARQAQEELYSRELKRTEIENAIRQDPPARSAAFTDLARRNVDTALETLSAAEAAAARTGKDRDEAFARLAEKVGSGAVAALRKMSPQDMQARRTAIEQVAQRRLEALEEAARRYDALQVALAEQAAGPAELDPTTMPANAPDTQPIQGPRTAEDLQAAVQDAQELFEEGIDNVLATNLNRRRFQDVLELEPGSRVRAASIPDILTSQAHLADDIQNVLAAHEAFRAGKQFLDGPADLKRLLRGAGKLEFRILATPAPENETKYDRYRRQLQDGVPRKPGDPEGWFKIDNPVQFFNLDSPEDLKTFDVRRDAGGYVVDKLGDDYFVLARTSGGPTDGLLAERNKRWSLRRARIDRDQQNRWCVQFTLDPVGGQMFYTLTSNNINKPLCILVDDVAYSAPNIQSAIRTDGQITGDFSLDKVNYLVQTMEGGTLPARLKDTPLSERTIGSSLGEANRAQAVRAGLIGTCAVVAIMLGYYWLAGAIANVAMLLNVMLVLAALAMLNARITLDGIAGIILSIGMSVDANVLIYERMREEKARGASLRMAIKNGYDKALRTIFDSNVTTLLTCVIIYYAGSEEVKGFGLTLGWGIMLNMFTAVFVTRTLFALLLKYNLIRDVKMMKLIGVPKIDWYSKSKFLIPVSFLIVLAGLTTLYFRGARQVLDVEFLGGVAAEFELTQAGLDDVAIGRRVQEVSTRLADDAERLAQATVTAQTDSPGVMTVLVPGVTGERLAALLTEPLEAANVLQRGGVEYQPGAEPLKLYVQSEDTAEKLADRIHQLAPTLAADARRLASANINAVLESGGTVQRGLVWNLTTTVTNMRLVEHTIVEALGNDLQVQRRVSHVLAGDNGRPHPIAGGARRLSAVLPDVPPGLDQDLTNYLGGAVIVLDQLDPPQTQAAVNERIRNMYFQPDFVDQPQRDFLVVGLTPAAGGAADQPLYTRLAVVTVDPELRYETNRETWLNDFAAPAQGLVESALASEQTLRKVMQFKPQIAARASQQALVALLLSWGMIIGYVWIRFGRITYGIGGVVALVHDVLIALAFVGFSGWLATTVPGRMLLIEDFRVNMPVIAALLTIIGFSINDTIVIFDRIREIRGRLGIVTPQIINDSINECMSRTILTTFTVLTVVAIAYVWGGSSIRGFNFCMLIGCLSGTYSTIVIAAPMLLFRSKVTAMAEQPAAAHA